MISCLVRSYQPNNWTHIAPLLTDWPFKPFARHDRWPPAELLNYTCERVQGTLGSEDGATWVALQHGEARGFACLTMLPWESEQLGICAARVDYLIADGSYDKQRLIKEKLIEQVQMEAHERGVWHLSARCDTSDLSSLHVLEEAGFITVETIMSFALDLDTHQRGQRLKRSSDFKVRLATPADSEALAELARSAFVLDRLHTDPFISPERAGGLHANALRDLCAGETASVVMLAEDASGPLAFISCNLQQDTRKQLGRMVGTAVVAATTEDSRGVAHAVMLNCLEWFSEQGCEIVASETQVPNLPVLAVLQQCGFRIVGSSISLRRLV